MVVRYCTPSLEARGSCSVRPAKGIRLTCAPFLAGSGGTFSKLSEPLSDFLSAGRRDLIEDTADVSELSSSPETDDVCSPGSQSGRVNNTCSGHETFGRMASTGWGVSSKKHLDSNISDIIV